jgi:hypothetical protein
MRDGMFSSRSGCRARRADQRSTINADVFSEKKSGSSVAMPEEQRDILVNG